MYTWTLKYQQNGKCSWYFAFVCLFFRRGCDLTLEKCTIAFSNYLFSKFLNLN